MIRSHDSVCGSRRKGRLMWALPKHNLTDEPHTPIAKSGALSASTASPLQPPDLDGDVADVLAISTNRDALRSSCAAREVRCRKAESNSRRREILFIHCETSDTLRARLRPRRRMQDFHVKAIPGGRQRQQYFLCARTRPRRSDFGPRGCSGRFERRE